METPAAPVGNVQSRQLGNETKKIGVRFPMIERPWLCYSDARPCLKSLKVAHLIHTGLKPGDPEL